jgi:hypothetical protein
VLTMLGGLQALQGVPAALWGDRMAPLSCHPVRHGPCAPPLGPVSARPPPALGASRPTTWPRACRAAAKKWCAAG